VLLRQPRVIGAVRAALNGCVRAGSDTKEWEGPWGTLTSHAAAGAAVPLSLHALPRLESLQELRIDARLELGPDTTAKLRCQVRQAITVSFVAAVSVANYMAVGPAGQCNPRRGGRQCLPSRGSFADDKHPSIYCAWQASVLMGFMSKAIPWDGCLHKSHLWCRARGV